MTYEELMTGAEVLNEYFRNPSFESRAAVIDSYEQLLSYYAEHAGCYCEWAERAYEGLEDLR